MAFQRNKVSMIRYTFSIIMYKVISEKFCDVGRFLFAYNSILYKVNRTIKIIRKSTPFQYRWSIVRLITFLVNTTCHHKRAWQCPIRETSDQGAHAIDVNWQLNHLHIKLADDTNPNRPMQTHPTKERTCTKLGTSTEMLTALVTRKNRMKSLARLFGNRWENYLQVHLCQVWNAMSLLTVKSAWMLLVAAVLPACPRVFLVHFCIWSIIEITICSPQEIHLYAKRVM